MTDGDNKHEFPGFGSVPVETDETASARAVAAIKFGRLTPAERKEFGKDRKSAEAATHRLKWGPAVHLLRSNRPIGEDFSKLLSSVFNTDCTANLQYRVVVKGRRGRLTKDVEIERASAKALVQAVAANARLERAERDLLADLLDPTGSSKCRLEFRAAKLGRPIDDTIETNPAWRFVTEHAVSEFRAGAPNLTEADFDQQSRSGGATRRLRLRDLGGPFSEGKPSRSTAYRNLRKARGTSGA